MARYFESHDSRPQTLHSINRVTLTPDVTTPAVPGSAEALHSGWEGYGGSSISRDQPMKRKSTKRPKTTATTPQPATPPALSKVTTLKRRLFVQRPLTRRTAPLQPTGAPPQRCPTNV